MMKTSPLLLAAILSFVACASDPKMHANDAHAVDPQPAALQPAEPAPAEVRNDPRLFAAAAEALREREDAGAAQKSPELEAAETRLAEARKVYGAQSVERREQADMRIVELRQQIDRAGAKATPASRDQLRTAENQRLSVTKRLEQLPRVSDDDFAQARTNLDAELEKLEDLLRKTTEEAAKFPP